MYVPVRVLSIVLVYYMISGGGWAGLAAYTL